MLTITTGTSDQLQSHVEGELAAYRHKVFVEHLGWDLPGAESGLERDQFDRPIRSTSLPRTSRARSADAPDCCLQHRTICSVPCFRT